MKLPIVYYIKRTPAGRLVWRIVIGLTGGAITVAGAVALIGPGPGILVLLAGLGILATEFAWAGRVMHYTKDVANRAAARTGMKPWVKYFLLSGGAVVSIIAIFIIHAS
jgi:uncharacterized protein (TIGR02611 family)